MTTATLTFCKGKDCSVPITDHTKHKIYVHFCKPCGKGQRSKNGTQPVVKKRTTPDGHILELNDKGFFASDEDEGSWVVGKDKYGFSLWCDGVRIVSNSLLRDCLDMVDTYFEMDHADMIADRYYRVNSVAAQRVIDTAGAWVEYEFLGTRDKQPFAKSKLKDTVGTTYRHTVQDIVDTHTSMDGGTFIPA